jgi:hypothetical protein
MRIARGDEPVAGGADGLEVTRRDEAGHAGDRKVFHGD